MPDTDDHQSEQHYRTILAKDVDQDLEDWLADSAVDRAVEVLDGEEQAEQQEETEDR